MGKGIQGDGQDSMAVCQTKGGENMKRLKNEAGFTMIELVVVIVILGILAAFAVPKYASLQTEARKAAVNGFAGGMRGAVAVVQAKYMVVGDITATGTPVTMTDGTTVAVSIGAGGGIPTGALAGIGSAMQDMSGFTDAYGATSTFTPTNGGSVTCRVEYVAATGAVTALTTC